MLNFNFLKKFLEIVSTQQFQYDFSKKFFSYHILLTDQISFSDLLLELLVNTCIATVCEPGCDVVNLKIDLIFQLKPFF